KVADPQPTSGALAATRLPSQLWLVRLLGILEFGAALAGLGIGSLAVTPGTILYICFAIFTWAALRGDRPLQSCGCFGREDTPPSWIHVGFNSVSALALGSVVLSSAPVVPWSQPAGELVAYLAFAGLGVYAAYLILTALPQTLALTRS
ncbi:MAG: hypothetical protein ACRDVL_06340, partial [Acidimicrobiia bacterium]